MKLIKGILLYLIITGCSKDDAPQIESETRKVVGDHIYEILQGDAQSGAPGQRLPLPIEIKVTDLQGTPVYSSLQFLPSSGDETTFATVEEGLYSYSWKFDCDNPVQTLSIVDNVCGVAKSGCIDAEIFLLTATSDGEVIGWFEDCQELSLDYDSYFIPTDETLFLVSGSEVYQSDNLISGSWTSAQAPHNLNYLEVFIGQNGELFYEYDQNLYMMNDNGSWGAIAAPYSSYGSGRMTILENGDYIFVEDYSSDVYSSTNQGLSWNNSISITNEGASTRANALVSAGNKYFIIGDGNEIIVVENGQATTFSFSSNEWPTYGSLYSYYAVATDNVIFLEFSNNEIYIIDLSNSSVAAYSIDYDSRLIKSNDKVYIMNGEGSYWEYEDGSLIGKNFTFPTESGVYNSMNETFYNNSPIFITYDGKIYQYFE